MKFDEMNSTKRNVPIEPFIYFKESNGVADIIANICALGKER